MSDVANRIKELRVRLGLTQEQLARRAGLTLKSVASIEQARNADMMLGTAQRLAAALGVAVDSLLAEPAGAR